MPLNYNDTNQFLSESAFFYTISIGMDSRYSYVSNSYNSNFDLFNDTLLGKHFSVTLHPNDVKICAEVGAKCFQNPGKVFPATLRKHNGNGGYVVTQWEMKAIFDEQNNPEGIFCIGYNITEYVDTRVKLISAENEIESKQKQLKEISYIQSHIIRRPLANIIGLTTILSAMEIDENLSGINDMILTSANELDTVIREIVFKADDSFAPQS